MQDETTDWLERELAIAAEQARGRTTTGEDYAIALMEELALTTERAERRGISPDECVRAMAAAAPQFEVGCEAANATGADE